MMAHLLNYLKIIYPKLINYLISYGYTAYLVMCPYFFVIHTLSFIMRTDKNYIRDSLILFVLAWCAQFLGHAIEGSRPALFTSITQSFSEAPLFSVGYILPFKLTSTSTEFKLTLSIF